MGDWPRDFGDGTVKGPQAALVRQWINALEARR